ncbi:MAG: diguanylate cyclase [Flavobacteriales bacterium]|nr:diguanylate cyclase [Flavobacteriales bacterium]|tara:strand:- start:1183 stop:1668 length:486 start_codon:yes stop_codon:yes gene_type:complete
MEVDIQLSSGIDKEQTYQELIPQLEAYFSGEDDFIANLANLSAILQEAFDFLWTGFYIWKFDELVLGPFQGPMACTRIQSGKGVCGTAFEKGETLIVPDVDKFPGHIACSVLSRSEIVVPMIKNGEAIGVLDIDSSELDHFDEIDAKYLEQIVALLLNSSN